MTALVVVAKEPVPGRVKTRLHPPFSLTEAAQIAAACLLDTLDAVSDLPATSRILLIDGRGPGRPDWQEWPQPSGTLDERIAWCLDELTGPMVLIGMDTPHLDAAVLAPAFDWPDEADAVLGLAEDGGYWALGLRHPEGALVRGVPMSRKDTGAVQLRRLVEAGLRVRSLPTMRDIDTVADLAAAADRAPRLATVLAGCGWPR